VVVELLAVTVPFKVAPVTVIPEAGFVITRGAAVDVVKVRSFPLDVPRN